MPKSETSVDAGKNSTCSAPGAPKRTRRFPVLFKDFASLEPTTKPEPYLVQFTATGKVGYLSSDPVSIIDVSRVVKAVHPFMAFGAVLSELDSRYSNLCIRFSTVVIRKA